MRRGRLAGRVDGIEDFLAAMDDSGADDAAIDRARSPGDKKIAAFSHLFGSMAIVFGSDRTRDDPDPRLRVIFDVGQHRTALNADRLQDVENFFMKVDDGDMASPAIAQPFDIDGNGIVCRGVAHLKLSPFAT
jgi:hypothetical protein